MLSIRGYRFALGGPLSAPARQHLKEASTFSSRLPIVPPFDINRFAEEHRPTLGRPS
jgi:hypothetical protein